MKNQLTKIHDECLYYEYFIESAAEDLEEQRIKAYRSGEQENFRQILPVLNGIAADVEAYREYLIELLDGGKTDGQGIANII